jgi:hypothetical protein
MLQAITTKHIGPSNTRGARVKATAAAGSVTVAWDHALDERQNHTAAAHTLANKMQWEGLYVGGGLPDCSGYVFVQPFYKPNGEADGFTA